MEHDFFTENPVKGANVYYMRGIIHGIRTIKLTNKRRIDAESIKILQNIVISMSSDSRLLIKEMLAELFHQIEPKYEVGEDEQPIGDTPEPLPPN